MHFLAEYGMFLLKTATLVIAILMVLAFSITIAAKSKMQNQGKLKLKRLNKKYEEMADTLNQEILPKSDYKKLQKQHKHADKKAAKQGDRKKTIFVINFHGDIKAQAVNSLREEVSAILSVAKPFDEVVLLLESPGGMVHGYGLAASQLSRIRQKDIQLTVCVDKVAASGGYLMACVANKIIAAPFAIIGSIGVIAQLPNFHRWLNDKHIDVELLTAGEYKRTLTMFGKNTEQGREKFQVQLEETHTLFKDFIKQNREFVDLNKVATGEYWYGTQALDLKLVDTLQTSDDYLLSKIVQSNVIEVNFKPKKSLTQRLAHASSLLIDAVRSNWHKENVSEEMFL